MNSILNRLLEMFSPKTILEHLLEKTLPDLVVAGLTFAGFYLFWKMSDKVTSAVFKKIGLDLTVQSFILTILKYSLLIIGAVTALGQMGIHTGSLIASLGIAGLTIGFAAKDALSNIISGIFIFWDRPFVIGDLIEINGHYGKVSKITMRSTRITTVDGKLLAIPNNTIVNSIVASYTNYPNLRLDIPFTVGLQENIPKIRHLVLGLVSNESIYLKTPAPELVVQSLNDYNIELVFRVWIQDEREHISLRFALREKVFEKLREQAIDMPLETIQVQLEK